MRTPEAEAPRHDARFRNSRRAEFVRFWPGRAALTITGLVLAVVAMLYAATVAVAPMDYGMTARHEDGSTWRVESVVLGGVGWRAGATPGRQLWWNAGADFRSDGRGTVTDDPAGGPVILLSQGQRTGTFLPPGVTDTPLTVSMFGLSVAFAAAGTLVGVYGRRRSVLALSVVMYAVAGALALAAVAPAGGAVLMVALFASVALATAAFVSVAFVLPVRGPAGTTRIGISVGLVLTSVPSALFVAAVTSRPELFEAAWAGLFVVAAIGAVVLFSKSLIALHARARQRDRRVARVILTTAFSASLPPVVLSLFPATVAGQVIGPWWASVLAVLIVPLGLTHVAVPTWRIRFQRALRQIYIHAVTWIALIMAYVLVVVLIGRRVAGANFAPVEPWVIVTGLVVVGTTMPFARTLVLRVLENTVYGDAYDTQRVMRTVGVSLASATSIDDLQPLVLEPVRAAVGFDWIAVTRPRRPFEVVAMATDAYGIAPTAAQVSSAVAAATRIGASEIGAAVVPCEIDSTVDAYLVAALREESFGLGGADASLLASIASQLASFMLRVDLWAQLQQRLVELDATAGRLQESQQTLSDLYEQVNLMLESERRRISRDLHDEPLQKLVLLQRALRDSTPGPYRSREALLALVDQAAGDLRGICERLRPPVLDDLGLEAALRWLAKETQRGAPFRVEVRIEGTPHGSAPDPELETTLYRAAQEALTNVLRHASASQVQITLTRAVDAVRLSVRDDGAGFDVPRDFAGYAATGHLGLAGLQERCARFGGKFRVRSRPGGPTIVQVDVPLLSLVSAE